jgi:hypothetical protein
MEEVVVATGRDASAATQHQHQGNQCSSKSCSKAARKYTSKRLLQCSDKLHKQAEKQLRCLLKRLRHLVQVLHSNKLLILVLLKGISKPCKSCTGTSPVPMTEVSFDLVSLSLGHGS